MLKSIFICFAYIYSHFPNNISIKAIFVLIKSFIYILTKKLAITITLMSLLLLSTNKVNEYFPSTIIEEGTYSI